MDLALSLGKTVEELDTNLTVVEFNLWQRYAAARMLPWRRMELYLAQIALKIVQVMGGGSDVSLSDYLFDLEEEGEPVEDAAAAFGFAPRKKVRRDG